AGWGQAGGLGERGDGVRRPGGGGDAGLPHRRGNGASLGSGGDRRRRHVGRDPGGRGPGAPLQVARVGEHHDGPEDRHGDARADDGGGSTLHGPGPFLFRLPTGSPGGRFALYSSHPWAETVTGVLVGSTWLAQKAFGTKLAAPARGTGMAAMIGTPPSSFFSRVWISIIGASPVLS